MTIRLDSYLFVSCRCPRVTDADFAAGDRQYIGYHTMPPTIPDSQYFKPGTHVGPRLKVDIKVQTNRTTEGQESEAPAKPQTDKRTKLFYKHKNKKEIKFKERR